MFVRPELRPLLFAARISSPARTVDPVATATAVVAIAVAIIVVAVDLPIKVVAAVDLTVIAAAAVAVVPRCAEELLSQIEMTETFRPDWTERKW